MENNITITEEYTLPSMGLIYNKRFDPTIKLRSMTVAEEMKRLSPSKNPYKTMSEIIEDCLLTKIPISVYDMCLGDYQYLLHKLRVVTYGPEYRLSYICPNCGNRQEITVNLDELKVNKYSEDINNFKTIILPKSNKTIRLKFQTPRDLDIISNKSLEMKEKFPELESDPGVLLTIESFIESVDGQPAELLSEFLKQLPLMDMNIIVQKASKINDSIGIDTMIDIKCNSCGGEVKTPFRFTEEFFRPRVD